MSFSLRKIVIYAAIVMIVAALVSSSKAAGRIDANTLVATSHGKFNKVRYTRYEAMFDGVSSKGRPYRVPCQIVTPTDPEDGLGLLLFDWLVPSTITTAVGQEQPDARYIMTDDFLFGLGVSYAFAVCSRISFASILAIPACTTRCGWDHSTTRGVLLLLATC
jgi:hypothetical protein